MAIANKLKVCMLGILNLLCWCGSLSVGFAASQYDAKAKEEGRALLYTSLAGADTKAFRTAFEKANPGVTLEIYRPREQRYCRRF